MKRSKNVPMNGPRRRRQPKAAGTEFWQLRLYVAGHSPNSVTAIENLKKMCKGQLDGRYRIEVIDLMRKPQLAKDDQIVAIPTLVRRLPAPVKQIIGNLSNTERVLIGLDLKPLQSAN